MNCKKMKSWLLARVAMVTALFGAAAGAQAEDKFYISDFSIEAGETKNLAIQFETDNVSAEDPSQLEYVAFQFDIYMPEGLTIVQKKGKYNFTFNEDRKDDHTFTSKLQSDGAIRVVGASLSNGYFWETSGDFIYFSVKAADDFAGDHEIKMSTIIFTAKSAKSSDLPDVVTKVSGPAAEEPTVDVTGITLDKTAVELTEGETATLVATVAPDNATDKTVTWSSSDEKIATVDAAGKVTAVAAGKATITAKAGDKTATCEVTVKAKVIAVTGITLDKTAVELTEGETATLVATVAPDNATDKTVTWSSSDEKIATVDAAGKVTAVAAGKATITAQAGEMTATCEVTVMAKEVIEIPEEAIYFWQGAAGTAAEKGGVATGHGACEGRVNYSNAGYYTISVNGKRANIETDYILITLEQELQANDQIQITGYRNKDIDANGTLYILFENGEEIDEGDNMIWNNVALGQEPNTVTYEKGKGAGSKSFKLSRSKSSTNVFITKLMITRSDESGIGQVEIVEPTGNKIYNLCGQRVHVESIKDLTRGIYIVNGKKIIVK